MVPKIAVPESVEAAVTCRALMHYARELLNNAIDPEQDIVKRSELVRMARIAIDLAEAAVEYVPDMPTEFPKDFDGELLVWLQNLK